MRNKPVCNIKILKYFSGIAFFMLIFSACGLNELVYLSPIEDGRVVIDPGANGLVFFHNTGNNGLISNNNFLGYEVFYKFYPYDNFTTLVEADRVYFYDRFISSESAITAQGFQPLYRSADNLGTLPANPLQRPNRPFLPVSSAGAYSYVISFPTGTGSGTLTNILPGIPSSNPIPIATPTQYDQPVFRIFNVNYLQNPSLAPANYFYLYRILNTTQNNYQKSFLPRLNATYTEPGSPAINFSYYNSSGDPDIQRLSGYTAGSPLCVGFCVVAYGSENFSPIYSEAVVINAGPRYGIYVQF